MKDTIKKLTLRQVELLTDGFLDASGHDQRVTNPLLLLIDDLARFCSDSSHVESVLSTISKRCYAGTPDADNREDAYIERVRGEWATAIAGAA